MPDAFGSFSWICSHTPLPQCNLFFAHYFNSPSPSLEILFPPNSTFFEQYRVQSSSFFDDPNVQEARNDAGTGTGSDCQIPRAGQRGSLGDIALIVLSAVSILAIGYLTYRGNRRKAAVGRVELRTLFVFYILHMIFQILTMSSLFLQGTLVLSILSSIHLAILAVGYWILLANAIVATQVVEDGTAASVVPTAVVALLIFAPTLYISLDTSQNWTDTFTPGPDVRARTLFVLTLIWPAAASVLFGILMVYVSFFLLREIKPAVMYFAAGLLFAGGQVVFFLASEPLCNASNTKINSAFLATLLQTASMVVLYFAWESITEETWQEDQYPYGQGYGEAGPSYY